jgi:N-terminal C2 in EEIG1 and EHBP1 proteins
MFRSFRRRVGPTRVFEARLFIAQLDSIPVTSAVIFVRWDVVQASLANPPTGRTVSRVVEQGNVVRWNESFALNVRIPSDPSDPLLLQPFVLRLSIRSERRRKAGFDQLGVVELDMAEVAAIERVNRSFLVHESILNSLLKVNLKMVLVEGDPLPRRTASAAPLAPSSQSIPPQTLMPSSSVPSGLTRASSSSVAANGSKISPAPGGLQGFASGTSLASNATDTSAGTNSLGGGGGNNSGLPACPLPPVAVGSAPEFDGFVPTTVTSLQTQHPLTATPHNFRSSLDSSGALRQTPISLPLPTTMQQPPNGASSSSKRPRAPPPAAPMSPRSPGESSAAAVLDSLVPESSMQEVYETMRVARVRDKLPPSVIASRVPARVTIDQLLAKHGHVSSAGSDTAI